MIGNLEPEENVMSDGAWLGQLGIALQQLGWENTDEVVVEIGGVAFSGINQTESANPKWAKPFGTVSYQNDAFIVIKNKTRSPVIPSQSNPDLKAYHES